MARPPKTFHEFIGQTRVIKHLRRLIAGAKELSRPCPSLLLTAPSGFGKTALGGAIATEYGSDLHPLLAGKDTRASNVCQILSAVQHGDIFFIDEAHSLGQDAQQVLYVALDQHKAPALQEGRLDRSQFSSIAEFTLLLATNQPGLVKRGLRSRLTPIEFDSYTIPELKGIAERVARRYGFEVTPQAARVLAEMAQGVPRYVERRIEALQLLWPGMLTFGQEHVRDLLSSEGVDEHGFWPHQRLYLRTLATSPRGLCSLTRLSLTLGCDQGHIQEDIEPYLIEQGLVEVLERGRVITAQGRGIIDELMTQGERQDTATTESEEGTSC